MTDYRSEAGTSAEPTGSLRSTVLALPARIRESQIDAILLRRLPEDTAFRSAFLAAISKQVDEVCPAIGATALAQQAHVGTTGTIDVLARFVNAAGRDSLTLLIEDKINARFTPNQPDRYVSSAVAMTRPNCPAFSVLCAPSRYLATSRLAAPFHARLSLEEIAEWLDDDDRDLLLTAVEQYDAPPEAVPIPAVADFHQGYGEVAAAYFPELALKRSPNSNGERPEGSFTIYFDTKKTLPNYSFLPTLRFSHQCQDKQFQPSVKVMFGNWAAQVSKLAPLAAVDLRGTGFYLRSAGASLAVVQDTPSMDNQKPVSEQMDAVLQGLQAAAKLRAWMFGNEQVLARWADAAK
jgi:hypothetical protein